MLIKASGIQSLTDARYFASRGLDWLGFCFDQNNPNYIAPREAQQMISWVQGPQIMGEFGDQPEKEILETAMILNLNGMQIEAKYLAGMKILSDLSIIARICPTHESDLQSLADQFTQLPQPITYFLLDLNVHFNSWEQFHSKSSLRLPGLSKLATQWPLMLAAPFNKENIHEILVQVKPNAIQLTGSVEQKTGEKSFNELDEMFALIER